MAESSTPGVTSTSTTSPAAVSPPASGTSSAAVAGDSTTNPIAAPAFYCIAAGNNAKTSGFCCIALGDNTESHGCFNVKVGESLTLPDSISTEAAQNTIGELEKSKKRFQLLHLMDFSPKDFFPAAEIAINRLIQIMNDRIQKSGSTTISISPPTQPKEAPGSSAPNGNGKGKEKDSMAQ